MFSNHWWQRYNVLITSAFYVAYAFCSKFVSFKAKRIGLCRCIGHVLAIDIILYFQEVTIIDQSLAIIHPDTFQGLYHSDSLHIDECNLKYSIEFSIDFPKLEHLSLLKSGLKRVPKVSPVADTLVSLILSSNRITSLENIYNIHFPKLSMLNLQANQIHVI